MSVWRVTRENEHTPQGNSLWIQGLRRVGEEAVANWSKRNFPLIKTFDSNDSHGHLLVQSPDEESNYCLFRIDEQMTCLPILKLFNLMIFEH